MRLNRTVDTRTTRLVPFVEAARNLVRAVLEADDGERRAEGPEALARRIRSWEKFKRAARRWCRRHGGRGTRRP